MLSLIQLSQDFKVSNGGPLNRKIQLKYTGVFEKEPREDYLQKSLLVG